MNQRSKLATFAILAWLLAVGGGLKMLLAYDNAPGRAAVAPESWPNITHLKRTAGVPTLLLFVHPHCPCSRASLGELAVLLPQVSTPLNTQVLFIKPAAFPEKWEETDLWHTAEQMPGVQIALDNEGEEAHRFDSQTSGQVMLYDGEGRLIFKGGITSARGHAGDNDGRSAILSLLSRQQTATPVTPVFGCPLFQEPTYANECDAFQPR